MIDLVKLITDSEDWLMGRTLDYATRQGYVKYTSTLKEAWRLSISGLSESIVNAIQKEDRDIELSPDEDYSDDPVAQFGIVEARRHRERGIDIGMFLGLLKYYRQAYIDLIQEYTGDPSFIENGRRVIDRCFDRIEIGLCTEWTGSSEQDWISELQATNRSMTNEKNKYLTIFESQPNPIIVLDEDYRIDNMNTSAVDLFIGTSVPGSQYYNLLRDTYGASAGENGPTDEGPVPSAETEKLIPWLLSELKDFATVEDKTAVLAKTVPGADGDRHLAIKLSRMLDVSGKFAGTIIHLEDVTDLKKTEQERESLIGELAGALARVKILGGLLPICSICKQIRDDKGYWNNLEFYIQEHSEAEFSHGICPECIKTNYPELNVIEE